jgi:hypothetical protein
MEKCFLSSAQHSPPTMVHSWLLFGHSGMQCKIVCSPPTNLDLFYRQNFTQRKKILKKRMKKKKNWVWNTALHTCIRKGPGGGAHAHKLARPGLVWSGLITKLFASQWLIMWMLSNTQNWCSRLLLFLHPWAISFCPPTACCCLLPSN